MAKGNGFTYFFDPYLKVLKIAHAGTKEPFFLMDFDQSASKSAGLYVRILEKTISTQASVLSSGTTQNLADLLDGERLTAILESSCQNARYCLELSRRKYTNFTSDFALGYGINAFELKEQRDVIRDKTIYAGRVQTGGNTPIISRSYTLPDMLRTLSESISQSLIEQENMHFARGDTSDLLSACAQLTLISMVLKSARAQQNSWACTYTNSPASWAEIQKS